MLTIIHRLFPALKYTSVDLSHAAVVLVRVANISWRKFLERVQRSFHLKKNAFMFSGKQPVPVV
jgi:hypothetical protein